MRRALIRFLLVLVALPAAAQQQTPPQYVIGVDFVQPTRECPVFIRRVQPGGPAEKAGVRPGDQLVSVDNQPITDLTVMQRFSADKPKPVRMEVVRADGKHFYDLQREKFANALERQGRKLVAGGMIVPADTTDAEVQRVTSFDPARVTGVAFPTGYPDDPALYYGGFQLITVKAPDEVIVSAMEDGPATHAGLHSGDVVLSVNGKDVKGLAPQDLEKLLTSTTPAKMTLKVQRIDLERTFEFPLWKASDVLRINQLQLVDGHLMPVNIPQKYQHCFVPQQQAQP
jgi:C-terminal processing protease CtpA/Prc